jgi:hypothetical protein
VYLSFGPHHQFLVSSLVSTFPAEVFLFRNYEYPVGVRYWHIGLAWAAALGSGLCAADVADECAPLGPVGLGTRGPHERDWWMPCEPPPRRPPILTRSRSPSTAKRTDSKVTRAPHTHAHTQRHTHSDTHNTHSAKLHWLHRRWYLLQQPDGRGDPRGQGPVARPAGGLHRLSRYRQVQEGGRQVWWHPGHHFHAHREVPLPPVVRVVCGVCGVFLCHTSKQCHEHRKGARSHLRPGAAGHLLPAQSLRRGVRV